MKITSKTINYTVETVEELSTIVGQENDVIVVTDENRGGTFVYRSAEAGTNNSGTIFNGWVRQYSGAVNVKWFGAKGDGDASFDNKNIIYTIIALLNGTGQTMLFEDGIFMTSRLGFNNSHNIVVELKNATLNIIDDISKIYEPFIKLDNNSSDIHFVLDSISSIKRNKALYTTGEHRHCVSFLACTNCSFTGGKVEESGGDGFYLGSPGVDGLPSNITIKNVAIDNNKRQGISIISGKNINLSDLVITNTSGTGPSAGIDLEPEDNYYIYNVNINNVRCIGNDGTGLLIYPKLGPLAHQMDINVNGYYVENGMHAIAIGRSKDRSSPININISGLQSKSVTTQDIKLYDLGSGINIKIDGQVSSNVEALAIYANNGASGLSNSGYPKIDIDLDVGGSGTLIYSENTIETSTMLQDTNISLGNGSRTSYITNSFIAKLNCSTQWDYNVVENKTLISGQTNQGQRIVHNYGSAITYTYTLGTAFKTGAIVTIEVRGNHPIIVASSSLIYPFGSTSISASMKYSKITLENIGSNSWKAIKDVGNWA